ncbi:DUF4870 domain-containing protein [Foetidibacter luteolus]|uniref:DUF4870 domain-containing protein n=1 Tax=Foetidibacter luteolus TaxID=2608880 RepID=UPI00129AB122|nr:DUF4870 domain-containing protein [Foetidibacter luteolus]
MANESFIGKEETPIVPPTQDEKTLALISHVLAIFIPFFAPLIIYLVKKDESSFIAAHSRESLNFQITLVIVYIICIITLIGWLLIWPIYILSVLLCILATIRASEGKLYRYPFTIRFIK